MHVVGKEARAIGGVSNFNKAASAAYSALKKEDKKKLFIRSQESEQMHTLSENEIVSAGEKIFNRLSYIGVDHNVFAVTDLFSVVQRA